MLPVLSGPVQHVTLLVSEMMPVDTLIEKRAKNLDEGTIEKIIFAHRDMGVSGSLATTALATPLQVTTVLSGAPLVAAMPPRHRRGRRRGPRRGAAVGGREQKKRETVAPF